MLKKIGPYRVEERLGVGGMGEVYKAFDDRLDRWVAIKRIRPDKEDAQDNRERFLREARATAKLNHPSIVHVYDIFKDGESLCIVMEYIDGQTLDTRVMEGALEPKEVLKLGYEIATGLAEAHSKGIIHRDLKVENIIMTAEGRAKILDFGLAKPILSNELDPHLTGKGQLVGTSRAMSPEYVSGEPIDHRSDLFSFGVLLYESATGHSPFKAQNTLATLKQVMVHEQTAASEMNSEVPLELSDLIDRLLSKDPEDRPQTAQEVAEELGYILGQFSSGSVTRPSLASGSSILQRSGSYESVSTSATATAIDLLSRRRSFQLGVVLATLVLGSFGLYQWNKSLVAPVAGPGVDAPADWGVGLEPAGSRDLVVVADFENRTGEELLDDTVGFAFRIGLEQSRVAQVLSEAQVEDALKRMRLSPDTKITEEVGIEICQREGARALLTGSIIKIGSPYQISGYLIDPQTSQVRFALNATANSQDEIIGALNEITTGIRQNLGESLQTIRGQDPLEQVTTQNLEALRAYSIASRRSRENDKKEAIRFFSRALDFDPEFAMAYAKLGNIYVTSSSEFDFSKALYNLDQALKYSDRLTTYEEIYVKGWVASLRGTPEDVVKQWSLMAELFPELSAGHRNMGMAQFFLRAQFEEAAKYFQRATEAEAPERILNLTFLNLGESQLALGQYDQAFESLKKSGDLARSREYLNHYIVTQDFGQARETLQRRLDEPQLTLSEQGEMLRNALSLYIDLGEFEEAEKTVRELRQVANSTTDSDGPVKMLTSILGSLSLLPAHIESEEQREAIDLGVQTSVDLLDGYVAELDLDKISLGGLDLLPVPMLALIGKLSARRGELELARQVGDKINSLASEGRLNIWRSYTRMLQSEILAAEGGSLAQAILQSEQTLNVADVYQMHETLAHLYCLSGDFTAAIEELEYMLVNRGRGYIDCLYYGCSPLNLMDWNLAHIYLEELGQKPPSDSAWLGEGVDMARIRSFATSSCLQQESV